MPWVLHDSRYMRAISACAAVHRFCFCKVMSWLRAIRLLACINQFGKKSVPWVDNGDPCLLQRIQNVHAVLVRQDVLELFQVLFDPLGSSSCTH